ncbi:endolytic transglycosylase MltG [Neptunicella marina]|uniref:Endolytic murein transglycosylase n=1 Tax=Neptunicella marina TaxID=2125989 RepID=A0A8J6M3U0_9ALTE|nr:endolytic transglycosylase MltG [Neptunicella marina]MBC3767843.1 endolytic transglycosylase MltG [Neptunicella marina]
MRLFQGAIAFLLLTGILIATGVYQYAQYKHQSIRVTQPQLIKINSGQSAAGVIKQLVTQDVIKKSLWSKVLFRLEPKFAKLKSGTYELLPGMRLSDVLRMMRKGDEKLFSITLVEGLRWRDWYAQIINTPNILSGEFDEQQLLKELSISSGSLEGWLMPDTYWFHDGYSVKQLVEVAYQAMQDYLAEQWPSRDQGLPYTSQYEALIMASIIEKETAVAQERAHIAGVFVNRLNNHMRLQTDPTVIYGLGDQFDGDIKRADLRRLTPYNTYRINGLPPTPIAMSGKAAIDAALHPATTDDLYFVAKGDGSHHFSASLQEHNQAVKRYQLNQSGQ